jgi:agmatine deiminase
MTTDQSMAFSSASSTIRIPADWETHACCWMSWAVHSEWGTWTNAVQDELATVIRAIAQFERVCLLVPPPQKDDVRSRFAGENVEIIEAPVDDIWMRDIAPTFALRDHRITAIDWNFCTWNQGDRRRPRPGDRLVQHSEAIFGVSAVQASFVAEGGALLTNGQGMVITTRSCLLSSRRNPARCNESMQLRIEVGLKTFGIREVVWLEGDQLEPITSGHVDGYVMMVPPNKILVEIIDDPEMQMPLWRHRDIDTLRRFGSAQRMEILLIRAPRKRYWAFCGPLWAPCYLNAYIANGAIIGARFGDPERDAEAQTAFENVFPGRAVKLLPIDHLCDGGGGVRCLTQPMILPQ